MNARIHTMVLLLSCSLTLACGSKSSGGGGSDAGSSGMGGSSGSSKTSSGSSSKSGSSTGAKDAGSGTGTKSTTDAGKSMSTAMTGEDAGPGGEPCGAKVCTASMCCADPFQSLCGAPLGMTGCLMPSPADTKSDKRCPALDVMGFFSIPSCCTADGQCGLDATNFGGGCTELGMFKMLALQMSNGMFGNTVPAPRPCN